MWRFINDFDHGFDMTFEQRFARENCNDRGEVLSWQFSYVIKYEMINYFSFCHQALLEQGKLPEVNFEEDAQESTQAEDPNDDKVYMNGRDFQLVNAPFPAPPTIARMWDLWILYSREYREFCLKFFGAILIKNASKIKESFEAYQVFRSRAQIDSCENLWPTYNTYEEFLYEMESPVVWITLK